MPMIDIYAAAGTFADPHKLATDAAAVVKGLEEVPDVPMFRQNTAAFIHEMPAGAIANVDGDGGYARVQVLTNAGALDREKQIAVVSQLIDLVAAAANDLSLKRRTGVLLTEATPGGWGLWDTPIRTTSSSAQPEQRLRNFGADDGCHISSATPRRLARAPGKSSGVKADSHRPYPSGPRGRAVIMSVVLHRASGSSGSAVVAGRNDLRRRR
jgi:hypothetical protein